MDLITNNIPLSTATAVHMVPFLFVGFGPPHPTLTSSLLASPFLRTKLISKVSEPITKVSDGDND